MHQETQNRIEKMHQETQNCIKEIRNSTQELILKMDERADKRHKEVIEILARLQPTQPF